MKRTLWLPEALPHQLPVLLSPARKKIVVCGRKWGKTPLGLMACLRGHGPKRAHHRGALDGGNIAWVAPNFTVASDIWRDLKRACDGCWRNKSEDEHRIELLTGGVVRVCSADTPNSLRGPNRDGIVVDEAAFVPHYLWTHVLRPQLSATGGWWIFITSPNGMNWIHDEFNKAASDPNAERWQHSARANPLLTPDEIEEMRLDMGPRGFAQEVEALFVSADGTEWPAEYFDDELLFDEWPTHAVTCKVMTLDPSLGESERSDFSAIVLMAVTADGAMWIDADIARRDATQISQHAIALARRFQPRWFGVEANGFQRLLAGDMERASKQAGFMLPIQPIVNTEKKITRIRGLTSYLSRREIHFLRGSPGVQLLLEQLRGFPLPSVHDDGPDALSMAVDMVWRLMFGGQHRADIDRMIARA
jgi:predicted phage terminase large subunit-like protein